MKYSCLVLAFGTMSFSAMTVVKGDKRIKADGSSKAKELASKVESGAREVASEVKSGTKKLASKSRALYQDLKYKYQGHLKGKACVVVQDSNEVWKVIAKVLAKEGGYVIIVGIDTENGMQVADEVKGEFYQLDTRFQEGWVQFDQINPDLTKISASGVGVRVDIRHTKCTPPLEPQEILL